jgi:hypothetical protein
VQLLDHITGSWKLIYLDHDSIYPIKLNLLAINSEVIKCTSLRIKRKCYLICDLLYVCYLKLKDSYKENQNFDNNNESYITVDCYRNNEVYNLWEGWFYVTAWSRVFEKLTVTQLLKKSNTFVVTVFRNPETSVCAQTNPVRIYHLFVLKVHLNAILYTSVTGTKICTICFQFITIISVYMFRVLICSSSGGTVGP